MSKLEEKEEAEQRETEGEREKETYTVREKKRGKRVGWREGGRKQGCVSFWG